MKLKHLVLLFVVVLFFWRLGSRDLWAPDEPYFAEGAREMVVDGQWAVPHVNGVVTPDKPPLFFWLIALFSLPFGTVSEWTARLPSALAGVGTVALAMRLCARWHGHRTAALAGVILSTGYLFWQKSRWSQTDALLCCLIWVALSAFDAYRSGDARGRQAGLLFWLATALAVLTKGPVGLLLPVGIALAVLISDRELGRWRKFAPLAGPAVFAAVVGAWILFATFGGPSEYSVWGALKEHFIDRGIEGLHHKRPPWYTLQMLPGNLMPWTGLIPGAIVLAWRRRSPGDRMALATALFVVVFFSISPEKRELYVLPAYPAFAVLAASLVGAMLGWAQPENQASALLSRRWLTVGHGVVGVLMTLTGLGVLAVVRQHDETLFGAALVLAPILAVTGIGSLYMIRPNRIVAALAVTAVGMAVTLLTMDWVVTSTLNPRKSARSFALRMKDATAESREQGLPVLAYSPEIWNLPEALAFYTDGAYTVEIDDPVEVQQQLGRDEKIFAVADQEDLVPFLSDLADRLYVVDSAVLGDQEVLLVTNHPYPGAARLSVASESR